MKFRTIYPLAITSFLLASNTAQSFGFVLPPIVHDATKMKQNTIQHKAKLERWYQQYKDTLEQIGLNEDILNYKKNLLKELGDPMDAQLKMTQTIELLGKLDGLVQIEDKELLDEAANGISAITRGDGIFEPLPQTVTDGEGNKVLIKRHEAAYRGHALFQRRVDQFNVERDLNREYSNEITEHSSKVINRLPSVTTESEYWTAKIEIACIRLQQKIMQTRLLVRYNDMVGQAELNKDQEAMSERSRQDYKAAITLGGANNGDFTTGVGLGTGIDYGDSTDVYGGNGGYDFSSGATGLEDYSEPSSGVTISKEAIELIIEFEVGGKSYYNQVLSKPTDPGGASGVTVGIGYDLGYNTPAQIRKDWGGVIDDSIISRLVAVSGMKGSQVTPSVISSLSDIRISYDEAAIVFQKKTLPRFSKLSQGAFPLMENLHPHSQGALVSLVFNRGSSLSGDRRREMKQIREAILASKYNYIPPLFKDMKRLWIGKGLPGLLRRRDAEAALFYLGLNS